MTTKSRAAQHPQTRHRQHLRYRLHPRFSGTTTDRSSNPRGSSSWRLVAACAALFATSLLGGFVATGVAIGIGSDGSVELGSSPASAGERPGRVVIDSPAEDHAGDDHGHKNPILDLELHPDRVTHGKSGREVLEFEVTITARAKQGFDYSYDTRIEDDMGRAVRQQPAGPAWSLASGKSALHPFATPDDLAPGYYKAIVSASASGRDGQSDQARSVFFQIDHRGSVIPMDRLEWLENSQATLGTSKPILPVSSSKPVTR